MTNISSYPLQDNFKTTLSQQWDGATGTVYVASTPSFTFPAGVTTYIVASPGKTTMQIAKINAYDATAKTLTVSSISLKKGASINSTAQTHSVGAEIIISDNYQFWEDIYTAVNSKIDGRVQGVYFYSNEAARNSDLGASPATDGLLVGLTTEGKITYSLGGSWLEWSTTSSTFVNASTTVAGKVEIGTQTQIDNITDTGETGAINVVIPSTLDAKVMKQASLVNAGITGEIKIWTTGTPPTNWLICDGSSLLRADYAALFAVIGTTYGAADGTHFTLPNIKGKVVVGYNASETEFDALGETGGEKTHTLDTTEIPAHTHTVSGFDSNPGAGRVIKYENVTTGANSTTSSSTGGGLAHNNIQPYITLNYIIRI